jgi:hypothetical protein
MINVATDLELSCSIRSMPTRLLSFTCQILDDEDVDNAIPSPVQSMTQANGVAMSNDLHWYHDRGLVRN